jgi:hypothetical protein
VIKSRKKLIYLFEGSPAHIPQSDPDAKAFIHTFMDVPKSPPNSAGWAEMQLAVREEKSSEQEQYLLQTAVMINWFQ